MTPARPSFSWLPPFARPRVPSRTTLGLRSDGKRTGLTPLGVWKMTCGAEQLYMSFNKCDDVNITIINHKLYG